jgi:septum formation protein
MRKAPRENTDFPGALALASASPRRQALLVRLGLPFRVEPPSVDETPRPGEAPAALVTRLALEKAAVVHQRQPDDWVLAADTLVVLDGVGLGKPADPAEALGMLARLLGRPHSVLTGVCLIRPDRPPVSRLVETAVQMRRYSRDEMNRYVASGVPFDRAGGYGIQDHSFRPVQAILGCYTNVVGLPLCAVVELLADGVERLPAAGSVCPHSPRWAPPPAD